MSIFTLSKGLRFFSLISVLSLLLSSCGNDENDMYDSIEGTWFGTRTYTGAGGATKYQYLTLQFNKDNTGDFQYESPVSFSVAEFRYSISSSTIHCKGVSVTSDGDVDASFELDLQIQGDRLIPINRFKDFILTRDGSVVTDANGNEINNGTTIDDTPDVNPSHEQTDFDKKVEDAIKKYVSVSVSYKDYATTFIITSSLKSIFPNETIEYGIGHYTYTFKPETSVSVGKDAYFYSKTGNGTTEKITFTNPFWFYFAFGNADMDILTYCQMYYSSYLVLIEKDFNKLSVDERSLFNSLTSELDKYESIARKEYQPTVVVYYRNKFYNVVSSKIP